MGIKQFLLLTYTAGPAAAIPYGLSFMDLMTTFMVLFVCYIAPLPLLFFILDKLNCSERSENRIKQKLIELSNFQIKVTKNVGGKIVDRFKDKWGGLGYYFSLVFLSFAFGFLWAAILAYVLGFDKKRAYLSIVTGTLLGLVFWMSVTIFSLSFIDPNLFILIMVMISLVFFIYGQFRERSALKELLIEMPKKAVREVKARVKRR